MDPIFRPALSSDMNEIVPLIYMSGKIPLGGNLFEILFGLAKQDVLDLLSKLFIAKTSSWLHHSVFYVAEIENTIAAITCAYLESENGIESMIAALIECGWKEKDFASLSRAGTVFNRVRVEGNNDWKLEFVATHPQHRRKGLAQILLHILLRKGKNRGLRHAQIAFFSDNLLAKKIYEKMGFRDEKTLKDPEFTKLFNSEGFTTLFQKL